MAATPEEARELVETAAREGRGRWPSGTSSGSTRRSARSLAMVSEPLLMQFERLSPYTPRISEVDRVRPDGPRPRPRLPDGRRLPDARRDRRARRVFSDTLDIASAVL